MKAFIYLFMIILWGWRLIKFLERLKFDPFKAHTVFTFLVGNFRGY